MVPTSERFEGYQAIVFERDDRLVKHFNLFTVNGPAQIAFERHHFYGKGMHFRVKISYLDLPLAFARYIAVSAS